MQGTIPGRNHRGKRGAERPMAKIKIDKELMEKIKRYARIAGYSSAEEFIVHTLEKQVASLEDAESEEEIRKKLQGLGYIS